MKKARILNNPQLNEHLGFERIDSDCLIQFDREVSNSYLLELNDFLKLNNLNPKIRFYSYKGIWRNLDFCSYIGDVKSLVIDEPYVENLEKIVELKNLESLTIGYTNKKINLKVLSKLNLISLTVEKNSQGLEHILDNGLIENLSLWNLTLTKPSILEHRTFELLTLNNVKSSTYEFLNHIEIRKELNLIRLNDLESINFIEKNKNLEKITLSHLKRIIELFDFSDFDKLTEITLDSLTQLKALSNIETVNSLKKLYLYNCSQLKSSIENLKLRADIITDF